MQSPAQLANLRPFTSETGKAASVGRNKNPYGRRGIKGMIKMLAEANGGVIVRADGTEMPVDGVTLAVSKLLKIANGEDADDADRIRAVESILNRLYGKPVENKNVTVRSSKEAEAERLKALEYKRQQILNGEEN